MQIRYLEAMQAMAKSANSKVIFLPGSSQPLNGAAMNAALGDFAQSGEGSTTAGNTRDFGGQDSGFQQAMNARVVENF
jgi:erythrocyte band 7 integral membrane protein